MRHSFKYLADIDPVSTSYVVFDDFPSSSSPAVPILDSLANLDRIIESFEDFQYAAVPLSRVPAG